MWVAVSLPFCFPCALGADPVPAQWPPVLPGAPAVQTLTSGARPVCAGAWEPHREGRCGARVLHAPHSGSLRPARTLKAVSALDSQVAALPTSTLAAHP